MDVKKLCLSYYTMWKFTFPSGRKPSYVTHSTEDTFKDLALLCFMNPLAVAMAMLVLITAPQFLATLRNFRNFKSIFLNRSGLPCFFSSNTFFGDRFSFVACLISIRYLDLNVCSVFSTRILYTILAYFFSSEKSSTSLTYNGFMFSNAKVGLFIKRYMS